MATEGPAGKATTWVLTGMINRLDRCARADTKNPPARLGHRPASGSGGEHHPPPSRSGLIAGPASRPHRKGTQERPTLRTRRAGSHLLRPRPHRPRTGRNPRGPRRRAPGRKVAGREPRACSPVIRHEHGRAGTQRRLSSRRRGDETPVACSSATTQSTMSLCQYAVGRAPLADSGAISTDSPTMRWWQYEQRFTGPPPRGRGRSSGAAEPRHRGP